MLETETTQISIGRTIYEVLQEDDPEDSRGPRYILTGPRGAQYATIRTAYDPHRMFLINYKNWVKTSPDAWFTDRNGQLELLNYSGRRV